MNKAPIKVLFLCTGNSARSIMAEALLNSLGQGRFVAHSAGSRPTGNVNSAAIDRLREAGHPTDGLRSKSRDEFAASGGPAFDYVITVCDQAASEPCPVWIGGPVSVHWGMPDPAAGNPDETHQAFESAYDRLEKRIGKFVGLPLDTMNNEQIISALNDIGAG
ncbi:MAG: arsenate reductase ArsC [Woeseia sp.]